MIQIVETSAAQASIVERETCRFDDVNRNPETRAKPQNRADVWCDVGLIESDFGHGAFPPKWRDDPNDSER
jgi:hypothetical protein